MAFSLYLNAKAQRKKTARALCAHARKGEHFSNKINYTQLTSSLFEKCSPFLVP